MAMSDDQAWFEANRVPIARQYGGMHVIIKDSAVIAAYPDYQSAYTAGVAMYGTEPFLVKFAEAEQFVEKGYMVAGKRRLPFLGEASAEVKEKLRRDGALVQVQISIPKVLADQMRAQGQTVPPPQIAVGMIDTGASISTVSEAVAQAAGLQQVGSVPISGVGGTSERPVMSCSFGLPQYDVVVDPAEIVAVSINAPGFEILVGRDILQALELKYQGPHGLFNLTSDVSAPAAAAGATGGNKLAEVAGAAGLLAAGAVVLALWK